MPITEIGEQACTLLGVSPSALVVVIGNVADHLERVLIDWQQSMLLHRHGAAGDGVRVNHTPSSGRAKWIALGIAKPPPLSLGCNRLDRVARGVDLHQRRRSDLFVQQTSRD